MKRFLTTAAALALTAGVAVASDTQIRMQVENRLDPFVAETDFDKLSDAQVSELYLLLTSDEMINARSGAVQKILEDADVVMDETTLGDMTNVLAVPANQLRQSVDQSLDRMGRDVDVATLTDSQVSELYLAFNSGEDSVQDATIDAIIQ